jgi:hypothetical protein
MRGGTCGCGGSCRMRSLGCAGGCGGIRRTLGGDNRDYIIKQGDKWRDWIIEPSFAYFTR